MSITSLVCGATSTNVPRTQCSSPAGERMHTSNAPPTCICTLASGTVKVSGLNQRFTCYGRAPGPEHRLPAGMEDPGKPERLRLLDGGVLPCLNRLSHRNLLRLPGFSGSRP